MGYIHLYLQSQGYVLDTTMGKKELSGTRNDIQNQLQSQGYVMDATIDKKEFPGTMNPQLF